MLTIPHDLLLCVLGSAFQEGLLCDFPRVWGNASVWVISWESLLLCQKMGVRLAFWSSGAFPIAVAF